MYDEFVPKTLETGYTERVEFEDPGDEFKYYKFLFALVFRIEKADNNQLRRHPEMMIRLKIGTKRFRNDEWIQNKRVEWKTVSDQRELDKVMESKIGYEAKRRFAERFYEKCAYKVRPDIEI